MSSERLAVDFLEELARDAERVHRGGRARIATDLQEDLGDLRLGDPVAQCAAQMRAQLVRTVEDADHREIEHAAGLERQALAPPDRAPAIFVEHVLQRLIEIVDVLERGVDIGVAQHLAADAEPLVVHCLVHVVFPRCQGSARSASRWVGERLCLISAGAVTSHLTMVVMPRESAVGWVSLALDPTYDPHSRMMTAEQVAP